MRIPNTHAVGYGIFAKNLDQQSYAGCTKRELRRHIESQFKPGMSWENFGDWEIDHITPVAFFDFSRASDFLACVHFSNLQPLWKRDNLRKRNRVGEKLVRPLHRRPHEPRFKNPILSFDAYKVLEEMKRDGKAVVLSTPQEVSAMCGVITRSGLKAIQQKRPDGKIRVGIKEHTNPNPILVTVFECGNWGIAA